MTAAGSDDRPIQASGRDTHGPWVLYQGGRERTYLAGSDDAAATEVDDVLAFFDTPRALATEYVRLREALQQIADYSHGDSAPSYGRIARAALGASVSGGERTHE